jgi:hypothetical protein
VKFGLIGQIVRSAGGADLAASRHLGTHARVLRQRISGMALVKTPTEVVVACA